MSFIPQLSLPHALTLPWLGYETISEPCRRLHTDAFVVRGLGQEVIGITGREACRLFYDDERFERSGAVPGLVKDTLFGRGGVRGLDGEAHRRRRTLFLALMDESRVEELMSLYREEWVDATAAWERRGSVVLHEAVGLVLCRAAVRFCGLHPDFLMDACQATHGTTTELRSYTIHQLAADCQRMVHGFGSFGLRMWRARAARRRAEVYLRGVVRQGRAQAPPEGSALKQIIDFRDHEGKPLDTPVAAVELLNVIRPIVAIATYVSFAALALRDYPRWVRRLREEDEPLSWFAHEVRRFYPFTPFVSARVKAPFQWKGVAFEPGTLVLLDVYGLNHDPRYWDQPEEFRPERFSDPVDDQFVFVPQGGGDVQVGHRCAGESLTQEILTESIRALTRDLRYELPAQDLRYSARQVPTCPKSGVILQGVRHLTPNAPQLPAPLPARLPVATSEHPFENGKDVKMGPLPERPPPMPILDNWP